MILRIIALSVIFICSWVAWGLLTLVVDDRTTEKSASTSEAVGQLWGEPHVQIAPSVSASWEETEIRQVQQVKDTWEYTGAEVNGAKTSTAKADVKDAVFPNEIECKELSRQIVLQVEPQDRKHQTQRDAAPRIKANKAKDKETPKIGYEERVLHKKTRLPLGASKVAADLDVEYRKKGLLWHSLYSVDFDSAYRVENPSDHALEISMVFPFPSQQAIYDNMKVMADGVENLKVSTQAGAMTARFTLPSKSAQIISFTYHSRGKNQWSYQFGTNINVVNNLDFTINTNFDEIDFPMGTVSPDQKTKRQNSPGYSVKWQKESLVSGQAIGMIMPQKINPGPLAADMSLHAPVSLFFFFFVLFMFQVVKDIRIHPMNYFFIAASFFAFNLLFSYLADQVSLPVVFTISSVVSIFLVVSYLKLVVGSRFALLVAGVSQLVFQVLFSVAHLSEKHTGLTITIGAILTLAIVMRLTAKLDWSEVFASKKKAKTSSAPRTEAATV